MQRLEAIRALGVSDLPLAHLPPNRLRALARYAAAARAQAIAQMTPERRLVTLLAFAHRFEYIAMDDALDLLDLVITDIIHEAQTEEQHARLQTLRDLDAETLQLWEALQVLLDEWGDDAAVRQQTFAQIPRAEVMAAGAQAETLARPPDDYYYPELVERYQRVRRFLPTLFATVTFEGAQAGQVFLADWRFLAHLEHYRQPDLQLAPLDLVSGAWRRLVLPRYAPGVDRRASTLCLVDRLQESLRRREIFVTRSEHRGDPRAKLLQGSQWEAMRPQVCRALGRSESPEPELQALAHQLDLAYQRTAANLPTNAAVWVDQEDGRDTLTVTGLDKLEEPLACSRSAPTSSPDSHGWISLRCSWKSMPVPALPMPSPISARAPPGSRTYPSASVWSCWPKPVTLASSRSCGPTSRR